MASGKKKRINKVTVRLEEEQYAKIAEIVKDENSNMSDILRKAIHSFISNESMVRYEITFPKEYREEFVRLIETFFDGKGLNNSSPVNSREGRDIRRQ